MSDYWTMEKRFLLQFFTCVYMSFVGYGHPFDVSVVKTLYRRSTGKSFKTSTTNTSTVEAHTSSNETSNTEYTLEELLSTCSVENPLIKKACVTSIVRKMIEARGKSFLEIAVTTDPVTASVFDSAFRRDFLAELLSLKQDSASTTISALRSNNKTDEFENISSENQRLTNNVSASVISNTDIRSQPDNTAQSSAVLIVPSVSDKVSAITEEHSSSLGQKTLLVKNRDWRRFTRDVQKTKLRMLDMASNMMCKFCQIRKEMKCVSRWCIDTKAVDSHS